MFLTLQLSDQDTQLLQMALYEYINARSPAKEYVEKRYPLGEFISEAWQENKLKSVRNRVEDAIALRSRLFEDPNRQS